MWLRQEQSDSILGPWCVLNPAGSRASPGLLKHRCRVALRVGLPQDNHTTAMAQHMYHEMVPLHAGSIVLKDVILSNQLKAQPVI